MRKRIWACCTLIIITVAAVFGYTNRQSYTDLSKEENYLGRLHVALIGESLATKACQELSQVLPTSPYILRVIVDGDIEHLFGVSRQKVCVQAVYAGTGVSIGQEIYIFADRWRLSFAGTPTSIERGFVNLMKSGHEYLVFASQLVDIESDSLPVYRLCDDTFITPVFCYDNFSNKIVTPMGPSTYVPYADVKENEFFAASEGALRVWDSLKADMLSAYPLF